MTKVKLIFEVFCVDDQSMSMIIENESFDNLPEGEFTHEIDVDFPSKLRITLTGKNAKDTIVENGEIVKDKAIILTDIKVHDVSVDKNYLPRFITLHTTNEDIVSNYWGFNGYIEIDFNASNSFNWLVQTKHK